MATMSAVRGKIKMDFTDPTTGEKFSEEPFLIDLNITDPATQHGYSQADWIDFVNDSLNAMATLSGADCTAKHAIYDQTLTD